MSNHCDIAQGSEHLPSWSLNHRIECEARMILDLPTLRERREALKSPLRAKRRAALEAEILRQYEARRRAA